MRKTRSPHSPAEFPHIAAGNRYAKDVVDGVIPACKWVRLACQRHLDDLESSKGHNYPYRFDAKVAEKWCNFLELLPHTKGEWARKGEKLKLEPWQCFKTICIFGWLRKQDGLRRFRKALILEPRKNAKSTWAAGVGLGMMSIDGDHGAEVYSGATTEKQAWEVFKPARLMAMKTPAFTGHFGVTVGAKNIHRLGDGSKFEPLIGDPGDGASPSCAIVDEYHEHATDRMVDTMETGMGAREQPLLLIITTAGDNLAGPCFAAVQDAERVLDGTVENDELFALIYTVDTTPQKHVYQSSQAIQRLVRECQTSNVPITQIDQCVREAFAICATNGCSAPTHLVDVRIIQTDPSETLDYAAPATSSTCSTVIQSISSDQSQSGRSGLNETETAGKPRKTAGEPKKNPNASFETIASAKTSASTWRSMSDFIKDAEVAAKSAGSLTNAYASIIATLRDVSEGYSVRTATQESVFSEILKRLFEKHSHILNAERCKLEGDSLVIEEPADDWSSELALRKANPNYDVSVKGEFLLARQRDVKQNPRKIGVFKTKHLNLWVQARDAYFDIERWRESAKPELRLEDFKGKPCKIGLDLASTIDIAAVELTFEHDGGYARFGRYYLPEATIELPENQHYRGWRDAPERWITQTDGDMIDYVTIRDDLLGLRDEGYLIDEIAFDPHQAHMMMAELRDEGMNVIEVRPLVLNFSPAMKQMDGLIRSRKIVHNGDPVFTWMLANVVAKPDAKDNVYPRKDRAENKIDGPVAHMMAQARWMAGQEGRSVYETRGILMLG